MKKANRIIAIVIIVFASIYYFFANSLHNLSQFGGSTIAFDPAFFPKVIAISMIIFSVILAFKEPTINEEIAPGFSNKKRSFLQILLIVLYPILMIKIGFFVSTILFLFVSMIYIGKMQKNNYIKAIILAFVITSFIYILIEKIFIVILPHGLLF